MKNVLLFGFKDDRHKPAWQSNDGKSIQGELMFPKLAKNLSCTTTTIISITILITIFFVSIMFWCHLHHCEIIFMSYNDIYYYISHHTIFNVKFSYHLCLSSLWPSDTAILFFNNDKHIQAQVAVRKGSIKLNHSKESGLTLAME